MGDSDIALAAPRLPPAFNGAGQRAAPHYLTPERLEGKKAEAEADEDAEVATPAKEKTASDKNAAETPASDGLNPEAVPWDVTAKTSPRRQGGRGVPPTTVAGMQPQPQPHHHHHHHHSRGKPRRPSPSHYYSNPMAGVPGYGPPMSQYYPTSQPPHHPHSNSHRNHYTPPPTLPFDLSVLVTYPPSAPLPPSYGYNPHPAHPVQPHAHHQHHHHHHNAPPAWGPPGQSYGGMNGGRYGGGKGWRNGAHGPQHGSVRSPPTTHSRRAKDNGRPSLASASEDALFRTLTQHGLGSLLNLLTQGGVTSREALAACTKEQVHQLIQNPDNRERLLAISKSLKEEVAPRPQA